MEKDITLHIRMDRDFHERVKAKAKELGMTVPAFIRMSTANQLGTGIGIAPTSPPKTP
jgi:antitoxin component of RelBE/YafQ-DinJ toxin-antitoxin module